MVISDDRVNEVRYGGFLWVDEYWLVRLGMVVSGGWVNICD